jgi:hypothetical protein
MNADHPEVGALLERVTLRYDQSPSAEARRELAALRQAVGQALDRKHRLGQYAVVWQDGQVRRLPPEALSGWPASAGDEGTALNR